MQPAADIVAGRAAAADHLVMTAAAAQVARPALRARRLAMHVAFREPARLPIAIDALDATHRTLGIANEAMARRQITIGRHAEISGASAARIGPMRAAMDLAHRVDHVGERIALARDQPLARRRGRNRSCRPACARDRRLCSSPRPSGALSIGEKPTL